MELTIDVGWASTYPVSTQHWSRVTVSVPSNDWRACELLALQMVACRPECVMVVETRIVL